MRSLSRTCTAEGSATTSCALAPRAGFTSLGALRSKVVGGVERAPEQATSVVAMATKASRRPAVLILEGGVNGDSSQRGSFAAVLWDVRLRAEDQLLGVALQAIESALDVAQRLLPVHGDLAIVPEARPGELVQVLRKLRSPDIEVLREGADGSGGFGDLGEHALAFRARGHPFDVLHDDVEPIGSAVELLSELARIVHEAPDLVCGVPEGGREL